MTGMGVILGTATYMSPEQARGRPVDKRTDVWAFGAVLYEMLTGARAFEGDDITEVIAAVVKTTPNWTALPADVPPTSSPSSSDASRRIGRRGSATSPSHDSCSRTTRHSLPRPPRPRTSRGWRRHAGVSQGVWLLAVLLVGTLIGWLLPRRPAARRP